MVSSSSSRSKALYHLNCGLAAHARQDVVALEKYARQVDRHAHDSRELQGYGLLLRARVARARGEMGRHNDLVRDALEAMNEAGAERAAAYVLLNIAATAQDPRESFDAARQSLKLFDRAGDESGAASACQTLGVCHLERGECVEAKPFLDRAVSVKRADGDRWGYALGLLNLSSWYTLQGRHTDALPHAAEAVLRLDDLRQSYPEHPNSLAYQTNGWASVSVPCEPMLANACSNLGNVLVALGDLEGALENYLKGLDLMQANGDVRGEALMLNQIGDLHREKGDARKAEEYFRMSRERFDSVGARGYMYGVVLQGIGEACVALGRTSEAEELYSLALAEYETADYRAGQATIMMLEGELMIAAGRNLDAIQHLERALESAQAVAATELVVRCYRGLGAASMPIESAQAREHLQRALLLAEDHGMKVEQNQIHRELASYYKLVGDASEALMHFERHHALEREVFSENAERRMQSFEARARAEQYKRSLQAMSERVREVEAELERRTDELARLAERIMEKQEFVRLVERGLERLRKARPEEKDAHADELLAAVHKAGDATSEWKALVDRFLSVHRDFAQRLVQAAPDLTCAELHVAVLIRLSLGAKQIADVLRIQPKTVFNHQQSIRRKLGLVNRENLKGRLLRMEGG